MNYIIKTFMTMFKDSKEVKKDLRIIEQQQKELEDIEKRKKEKEMKDMKQRSYVNAQKRRLFIKKNEIDYNNVTNDFFKKNKEELHDIIFTFCSYRIHYEAILNKLNILKPYKYINKVNEYLHKLQHTKYSHLDGYLRAIIIEYLGIPDIYFYEMKREIRISSYKKIKVNVLDVMYIEKENEYIYNCNFINRAEIYHNNKTFIVNL